MKALSLILLFALAVVPQAWAGKKPALAPVNPEFIQALEARKGGLPVSEDGRVLGHLPSPLNLEHLAGQLPVLPATARQYPARFSICDEGKCPPVYDQGSCGSCWAFGSYGSVESALLPDEVWDFSENNMIMHHDFNNGACSGGGRAMATAYLVRWSGPVLESDDPYLDYNSPSGLPEQKHVQNVYWVTGRFDPYNVAHLPFVKHALMNYGGLYWAYMHSGSYYNSGNNAYYYPGSSSANHAVTLVGWDDEFSKENFNNTPPQDGAFILRNSWGTGFGEDGYFYASYYDASIEVLTAYLPAEELTNFSFIYQYDWLGATSAVGSGGISGMSKDDNTYWGANIFEADGDEWLAATGFYTVSYNSSYRILVYTDVVDDPTDGTLAGELSGTIEYPGYHTIPLEDLGVLLTEGTRFAIAVEFNTPGYEYPVPVERPVSGYASAADASYGESFIRATENDDWLDLHGEYSDTNVCIKVFTQLYCDDGDACTEDTAAGSECVFSALSCDDQNSCTTDSCDSSSGCLSVPLADCSLCDNLGVCQSGFCLDGAQSEDVACDDGDTCTQTDLCDAGTCTGSDPVVCQALDQCHAPGVCDPESGLCSDPALDDGIACDDEDLCTQSDTCQAGVCTGALPVVCEPLDSCRAAGICDPQTGVCSEPLQDDGTTCDDGDLCTQSDTCQAGVCSGADPVICQGADACHQDGVCNPQTGECGEPPALSDGSPCDDDNPCTGGDSCQAGSCQGTTWPDGSDCPEGTCQAGDCQPEDQESVTACGCSSSPDSPRFPAQVIFLGILLGLIGWRRG